jgi:hypothetical protein
MLKFVWFSEFQPKQEPPPNSWGWWHKRVYGETIDDVLNNNRKSSITQDRKPIGGFAVRVK